MIHPALHIPLPFYGRMLIERNNSWYGRPVNHSPVKWAWWKLFSIKPVRTNPDLPRKPGHHSFNVWVYTRKDAICIHVIFSHKSNDRPKPPCKHRFSFFGDQAIPRCIDCDVRYGDHK